MGINMALVKIVRFADSLFYNTETEINRIVGHQPECMRRARIMTKEHSLRILSKRGLNIFYQILIFNTRLREWMHVETWKNGYQEW